jgi:2-keto-4-pentenoate hydratase
MTDSTVPDTSGSNNQELRTPHLEQLAERLADARRSGHCIDLPVPPVSLSDAYEIQEHVSRLVGTRHVGWKVGSTSKAAQARLDTSEPGAGRLLEPFVFTHGAQIPVSMNHDVQLEVEFAFRMGRDLAPRAEPYDMGEVHAAVAAFLPAIEIVGSRYCSGLAGAGQELVTADGGANIAFVYGAAHPIATSDDLAAHACELIINDKTVAHGVGANALDGPFNVLVWLVNHLGKRNITLGANELVSTGTCTGLVASAPGDQISGRFGDLGEVSFSLVPMKSEL